MSSVTTHPPMITNRRVPDTSVDVRPSLQAERSATEFKELPRPSRNSLAPNPGIAGIKPSVNTTPEFREGLEGSSELAVRRTHGLRRVTRSTERRFQILQQWEGIVQSVGKQFFRAQVSDVTEPSNPLEVVSLPLDDVLEDDRPLIAPGAVFYWIIGYDASIAGTRSRASSIRFQRWARWSSRELDEISAEAEALHKELSEANGHHRVASRPANSSGNG